MPKRQPAPSNIEPLDPQSTSDQGTECISDLESVHTELGGLHPIAHAKQSKIVTKARAHVQAAIDLLMTLNEHV